MFRLKTPTILFALLSCCMHVKGDQLQKEFTGIKTLEIRMISGDCTLKKGESDVVSVDLDHDITGNYHPSVEQVGEKLIVKESFGKGSSNGRADWTIELPDNLEIDFSSSSGDFEIADWSGQLHAKTSSGDLEVEDFGGNLKLTSSSGEASVERASSTLSIKTSSGDIEVKDTTSTEEAHFHSSSGDIKIKDYKGDIKAKTSSGEIELKSVVAKVTANSSSGRIKCKDASLTQESEFHSGSGDIEVSLAEPLNHGISITSGSGDSTLDCEDVEISGKVVMVANKKNGEIDAPFDFDTVEEIDKGKQAKIRKTAQLGDGEITITIKTGSGISEIKE